MTAKSQFDENKDYLHSFLDSVYGVVYEEAMRRVFIADSRSTQRLLISLDDIRRYNADLAGRLLEHPMQFVLPWMEAISDRIQQISHAGEVKRFASHLPIGFVGSFGSHRYSPRDLRANHLGSLVCVEGVVTRCSIVQPKLVRSVHWCKATQQHMIREHCDSTTLDQQDGASGPSQTSALYPTCDVDGNPFEMEFGLSVYRDHQSITIQEAPERAPLGQLPRSVCSLRSFSGEISIQIYSIICNIG